MKSEYVQTQNLASQRIDQDRLGNTLWVIAGKLRGAINADSFRDYMLSFLILRYLSSNYEEAAKKELGRDYPESKPDEKEYRAPLAKWYTVNETDVPAYETQMRRKVHYVIKPEHLWNNIPELARIQSPDLLITFGRRFSLLKTNPLSIHFKVCSLKST